MPFDAFLEVASGSPWAYVVILAVAALDALVPVVPSEATVISAGVLAGAGDLEIGLVVAAGAMGAYVGDSSSYWLGRRLGHRIERTIFRGGKAVRRRDWAERTLERDGGPLIFGARFVPGGRTAITLTAGIVGMRWRRFAAFAAGAGLAWASYAGLVGYLGGRAFEHRPLLGLAFGFAVAVGIYLAVEAARRVRRRRRYGRTARRVCIDAAR